MLSKSAFPEVLCGVERLLWGAAAAAGLLPRAVLALLGPTAHSAAAWSAHRSQGHACSGERKPVWRQGGIGERHSVPPCAVLLSDSFRQAAALPGAFGRFWDKSAVLGAGAAAAGANEAKIASLGRARRSTDAAVRWLAPLRKDDFLAVEELGPDLEDHEVFFDRGAVRPKVTLHAGVALLIDVPASGSAARSGVPVPQGGGAAG